jgi:hypothetical protein
LLNLLEGATREGFELAANQSRKGGVMRKVACRIAVVLAGASVFACVWAWPGQASAAVPFEIEGGGYIGYATNPSHGPNPLGVGIGARAGVDAYNIYAGIAATYYFGSSGNCGAGAPSGEGLGSLPPAFCGQDGAEISISQMTVLYGVDLGYTLSFPRAKYLKIRPILELGDAELTRSGSVGKSDITEGTLAPYRSANAFYLQPGLEVFLTTSGFFIGADANLLVIPSITDIDSAATSEDAAGSLTTSTRAFVSFTAHAQIGFRF